MVLKTVDDKGKTRSFEVEALVDEDEGVWSLSIPCITETHAVTKAWLETPVARLAVRVDRSALRCGGRVELNREKILGFYKAYEC